MSAPLNSSSAAAGEPGFSHAIAAPRPRFAQTPTRTDRARRRAVPGASVDVRLVRSWKFDRLEAFQARSQGRSRFLQ